MLKKIYKIVCFALALTAGSHANALSNITKFPASGLGVDYRIGGNYYGTPPSAGWGMGSRVGVSAFSENDLFSAEPSDPPSQPNTIGVALNKTYQICDGCEATISGRFYNRTPIGHPNITNEAYLWIGPAGGNIGIDNPSYAAPYNTQSEGMILGAATNLTAAPPEANAVIIDSGGTSDTRKAKLTGGLPPVPLDSWFTQTIVIQRIGNQLYIKSFNVNGTDVTALHDFNISAFSGYDASWLGTGFNVGAMADDLVSEIKVDIPEAKINKNFDGFIIAPGEKRRLIITAENLSVPAKDIDNMYIKDLMPYPLQVDSILLNTCNGNITYSSSQLEFLGTLPASGCEIQAEVIWPANLSTPPHCPAFVTNTITPGAGGDFYTDGGQVNVPVSAFLQCEPALVDVKKTTSATSLIPGATVPYTIEIKGTNNHPAIGLSVQDTFPPGVFSSITWECKETDATNPANSSSCGNGSGDINETNISLPKDTIRTYEIKAVVSSTPPASYENEVEMNTGNGFCDKDPTATTCKAKAPPLSAVASVKIEKSTTTLAPVGPGAAVRYSITVTNPSAVQATNITVADTIPAGIASGTWSCTGSCGTTNGNLPLNDTIANLAAGASTTYTIDAITDINTLPTQINNIATATPAAPQLCVDATGNISAPPCKTNIVTLDTATPVITIAQNVNNLAPATPGGTITYVVTVTNTGTVPANNITVTNPLPNGITGGSWSCSPAALCGTVSGNLPINHVIANLPPGAVVTYTVTATVAKSNVPNQITNVATASSPNLITVNGNLGSGSVSGPISLLGAPPVNPIPTLNQWSLLILALLLMGFGFKARKTY